MLVEVVDFVGLAADGFRVAETDGFLLIEVVIR